MAKLKAGDKFPDFQFDTAYERGKTIFTALNEKPTFIIVLRYIGCTVCRYDIHLLQNRYQEFLDMGAQVLVVMQSQPETVREDLKGIPLPFDIICDPDMHIYQSLEIGAAKDKAELIPEEVSDAFKAKKEAALANGFAHGQYEGIEEQLPATFLLDGTGTVKYAHYGKNIMDKPGIDEMLAML